MRPYAVVAPTLACFLALFLAAPLAADENPPPPAPSGPDAKPAPGAEVKLAAAVASPAPIDPIVARRSQLVELAKRDPMAIARMGRERLVRDIRDYSCTFIKQEFVGGKLKDVEEIDVRCRVEPLSVFMFWKKGADQVKRALFVDSPRNVDRSGQKLAKVEPAGALIRLVVSEVDMPIHGKQAREASRRTIDEFGFKSTFDILEKYNAIGEKNGVLDYRFDGEGMIDGRPTLVFVRRLPYTGPNGVYPDAKMVLHIDQDLLLPTAVYSYSDPQGTKLLGSYVYTNIRVNPGFADRDFEF